MSRDPDPQVSFADLEFSRQGIFLNPDLASISCFLDEHEEIIEQVRGDLQRGLKKPQSGRPGLTPAQVLRSLILMRVKNWQYRELRERIADGYTLRGFTDFRSQPVPQHDAFHRAFNRLTPATLRTLNELVVKAAVQAGLEDGQQLRVDTTVVQTNIHHPTDNTLLWDAVRVITRLVGHLQKALTSASKRFRKRTRAAKRRMQEIQRLTSPQRPQQQIPKYRQLLSITQEVLEGARAVIRQTLKASGKRGKINPLLRSLCQDIEHYCQLGDRVVDQTYRRLFQGEQVPATEKVYSLFESHTDLIKRGKVQTPLEFGHKVFLAESAHGLITQYEVLEGNPSDDKQVEASLQRHRKTFGHAPRVYGTDRGFYSQPNLLISKKAGVKVVSIPQRGGQKTARRQAFEKSPAFKKAQRFRAGIEGRISVLFRGRGMKRCRAKGRPRFELLVGAAVLANNLMRIAALQASSAKPRAA
jgi:transposase, IS5 family